MQKKEIVFQNRIENYLYILKILLGSLPRQVFHSEETKPVLQPTSTPARRCSLSSEHYQPSYSGGKNYSNCIYAI